MLHVLIPFKTIIAFFTCEVEQTKSVCSKKRFEDVYDFFSQICKTAD